MRDVTKVLKLKFLFDMCRRINLKYVDALDQLYQINHHFNVENSNEMSMERTLIRYPRMELPSEFTTFFGSILSEPPRGIRNQLLGSVNRLKR